MLWWHVAFNSFVIDTLTSDQIKLKSKSSTWMSWLLELYFKPSVFSWSVPALLFFFKCLQGMFHFLCCWWIFVHHNVNILATAMICIFRSIAAFTIVQVWCLLAVIVHLLLQCVYWRNLLLSTFSYSFRCSEVWARFLVPDDMVDGNKLSQPVTYLLTSAWLVTGGRVSCRPAWWIMWYPSSFPA